MSEAPFFTVILVNYNGGDYIRRAVDALAAQDFADFEAVIVDNGSTDGSLEALPELDARFRIDAAGENLGFAVANNRAAKQSRAPWLVTLNPDAFARPGWLSALHRATQNHPYVTMFGSMQVMADLPDGVAPVFDGTGDEYSIYGAAYRANFEKPLRTFTEDFPVFGPCAAAAAYQREAFEAAGGFDERFFCYHEDVDLALKMRRLGGRAVQVHDAVVEHVGSGISGRTSDFAIYHGYRNRVWTWMSSMPAALAVLLLPLMVAANLAQLAYTLKVEGRTKPMARGLWHGLTGTPAMLRARRKWPKGSRAIWPALVKNPRRVKARANRVGRL
jgi:GT2 family glycosyltransferase